MTARPPLRLVFLGLLGLLILVAGVFSIWQARRAVKTINLLPHTELKSVRAEYESLATTIPSAVRQMNTDLVQFTQTGNRAALADYEKTSNAFRQWLAEKRAVVTAAKIIQMQPASELTIIDVRSLVDRIEIAFREYDGAVRSMSGTNRPAGFERAVFAGSRLLVIAGEARGKAESLDVVLKISRSWFPSYEILIKLSVLVLIALMFWSGLVLYRVFFVPLRTQLIETSAIVGQQKKLAHFGELAAGLAHEIRNPLTAINARLYTLQRGLGTNTPEAEDAGVIGEEITRLDRIVNEFLNLARPADPVFGSMVARGLFQDIYDLYRAALAGKAIELKIGDCVDTPFRADRQQLKQVLINLVQNAADAIGTTGTITLTARFALQKLKGLNQEVVLLEVTDTGPGIPPEVQRRLFDPFFSTKDNGTGLGLPISARIVDQHGGALEFQSQLGRGTTFGVIIPVTRKSDAPENPHH